MARPLFCLVMSLHWVAKGTAICIGYSTACGVAPGHQMHRICNELSRSMELMYRSGDNAAPFLIDRRAFAPALLHD
jgi:hypothetical protein